MRFSLLGEVEIESGGHVIGLRGRRLRPLVACLLVNRNHALSRDRLVEAVWEGRPPPSQIHGLEALVSRLRHLLGPEAGARIETTSGGYRLCVAADELDVDRFERLLAAGRRALAHGDAAAAIEHLRRGLDEWRGPAFGELVFMDCFTEDATRLEELRLDAFEALFEARLECDRHEDLVSEIEAFVVANPLREHARAQLMRALYGCGRQTDALEVYRTGYRLLAEQGLEPGAELRRVQAAILHGDALLTRGDPRASDLPVTRYVHSRGAAIAYQVSGEGLYDIVYAPPFVTNVELTWQVPRWAELLNRLGSFSRLIRFDKRGTGMSDRESVGTFENNVEDIEAVMDATLSTEAAIIGASQAGPLAIQFTALHPERVWALVLWGTTARVAWAEDYPFGVPQPDLERDIEERERIWTEPGYAETLARAIGAADAPELASLWRQSATPGIVRAFVQHNFAVDVREVLPLIHVPTLVLNREGDDRSAAGCRYLAEHLVNARHVVFPGADHVMYAAGDFDPILHEIKVFLDRAWEEHAVDPNAARSPSPLPMPLGIATP